MRCNQTLLLSPLTEHTEPIGFVFNTKVIYQLRITLFRIQTILVLKLTTSIPISPQSLMRIYQLRRKIVLLEKSIQHNTHNLTASGAVKIRGSLVPVK